MRPYALALRPEEAGLLVDGWPEGIWLVAAEDLGGRRWDAGAEADLPTMIGNLPVWPPLDGFAVAEVPADAEASLIRHLASLPGIAAEARRKVAPADYAVYDEGPAASDIDWDD